MKKSFERIKILMCLIVFCSCLTGCGAKIIRDKKYVNQKVYSCISLEFVFPDSFDKDKVIDFAYYETPFKDSQYFVQMQYTQQEFDAEFQRLANAYYNQEYGVNYIFYDENSKFFNYPTFISHYRMGFVYVYACLEFEQCIITYVYTMHENIDDILFDHKYLPRNFSLLKQWEQDSTKYMCFDMESDSPKENYENWYSKLAET